MLPMISFEIEIEFHVHFIRMIIYVRSMQYCVPVSAITPSHYTSPLAHHAVAGKVETEITVLVMLAVRHKQSVAKVTDCQLS